MLRQTLHRTRRRLALLSLGLCLLASPRLQAQSSGYQYAAYTSGYNALADTVTRFPSLTKRIQTPRLTTRIFAAPEHGAVELTNGGTYLISRGLLLPQLPGTEHTPQDDGPGRERTGDLARLALWQAAACLDRTHAARYHGPLRP